VVCGVGYAAPHATEILIISAQKSDNKWYAVLITTGAEILSCSPDLYVASQS
jgi:hypothetical protein